MESVTANAILLIQLVGNCIQICVIGHGLMECGIEYAYLRNLGQELAYGVHTLKVCGVVQGRQVVAGCECLQYLRSQNNALVELLSSVHHAVSDCVDLIK